jgi:hypothetical protein
MAYKDVLPSKTAAWKKVVDKHMAKGKYFWTTPPVPSAYESERALVVSGSEEETEYLRQMFDDIKGENGVRVDYTSDASRFWEKFFGKDDFLGGLDERTIPNRIVTTGYIQTPYMGVRKTKAYARMRLKEIAGQWNIPISFIQTSES